MRLVVIGCEYAGKTTLARGTAERVAAESGSPVRVHDHWVVPHIWDQDPKTCYVIGPDGRVMPERGRYGGLGGAERDELADRYARDVQSLAPWVLEQHQRAMVWRHLHPTVYEEAGELGDVPHSIQVDFYYAEAVYAPLYYGYGGPDTFPDRNRRAREWDEKLMDIAAETVLVHGRATAAEIGRRMSEAPHAESMLRSGGIERVLEAYAKQLGESLVRRKIEVDTSGSTPERNVAELASQLAKYSA
jgi:hypothetical protein